MELMQEILTAIGGITVVLVTTLTLLRRFAETYINSLINKSANKELERVKNNLARSMSAYQLLVNKEFEFYQKIDVIFASLIVDVQDYKWNLIEANSVEKSNRCNKLKEITLRILKTVPELKNFSYMYQCYIPVEVNRSVGDVVISLQDNLQEVTKMVQLFNDNQEINENLVNDYVELSLISIAKANTKIKIRLDDLSS